WKTSYTLQTGSDWVSGVYLVKMTTDDGNVGYIMFVVRDDSSTSDIVFQIPVNTYQAYNTWGAESLYINQSSATTFSGPEAYMVSFDRPYNEWDGAGSLFDGDYGMIRF